MIPILQECWWDVVSKTWFCCGVDLALGFVTPASASAQAGRRCRWELPHRWDYSIIPTPVQTVTPASADRPSLSHVDILPRCGGW